MKQTNGIEEGREEMGLEDRDWYRESFREKEKKYGSDFSKQGKTKKNHTAKPEAYSQNPKLQYQNKRMEQNIISMFAAAAITFLLVPGAVKDSFGGPIIPLIALALDIFEFVEIKKDENTDNSVHKLVNMLALVVVGVAIAFAAVAAISLTVAFFKQ